MSKKKSTKFTKEEKIFTADLMQALGGVIKDVLPKDMGFALLVFNFDAPGIGNYISNGSRENMITSLRETASILEKNQDKPRYPLNDEKE